MINIKQCGKNLQAKTKPNTTPTSNIHTNTENKKQSKKMLFITDS